MLHNGPALSGQPLELHTSGSFAPGVRCSNQITDNLGALGHPGEPAAGFEGVWTRLRERGLGGHLSV